MQAVLLGGTLTRILLVDDSDPIRKALRRVLENHYGWEVCGEASNGHEAVECVQRYDPDIVLLDFKMPDMNGLEVAKRIVQLTKVPILMVTMHVSNQLATEAKKAGIRGTCAKEQIKCVVHGIETLLRHDTYFPEANLRAA